jgi:hypothetical protein
MPCKIPRAEQDYGLFYYTGYAIVYLYNCVTVPILMLLFNWWHMVVPVAEAPLVSKAALDLINEALMAINRVGIGAVVTYEEIIFVCSSRSYVLGRVCGAPHHGLTYRPLLGRSAASSLRLQSLLSQSAPVLCAHWRW